MNVIDNSSIDMIDENDELEAFYFEENFSEKVLSEKRNARAEIEKRLEMLELSKLTSDSVYDELFD